MKEVSKYIREILGTEVFISQVSKNDLGNMPMYITQLYKFYAMRFFHREVILVALNNEENISILQITKHLQLLKKNLNKSLIVVFENLMSYNRKRLIEKGVNFIVPGKQLYLPELLIDLRENFSQPRMKSKGGKLMPSAQLLLFYHILHRDRRLTLENIPFKEIALKLGYTPMAISNAVEDLRLNNLIEVHGEKEKFIKFNLKRSELWDTVEQQNLLSSPVIKTVYVDNLPKGLFMLKSNTSALSEYSNMNPSRKWYFAIEKSTFYGLQKNETFGNVNDNDGNYSIEVWKYNPETIVEEMGNEQAVVDPLSLYLSLKDSYDERIDMALEQIIEKYIW